LKGFGGRRVLEIVDDFDGDSYRVIYTVKFSRSSMLHAFQKKSKRALPPKLRGRVDWDSSQASRAALQDQLSQGSRHVSGKRKKQTIAVERGSGNVFADLGFDRPEEELLKAQLVREIRDILKRRRLTQLQAAELLGLKQPDVSALVTGRVHKFSLERLLRCVRRLDRDVAIVIRPIGRARPARPRHRAAA
jgi:predicted XRE-type DNA-binding protein